MYKYDTYRRVTAQYINDKGLDIARRWSYQFGIFTGATFVHIYEMFREYGLEPEKILAFDSFEGLPDEVAGVQKNPIWQRNEFNAKYIFNEPSTEAIIERIMAQLPDRGIPVEWFEGYFCDVLTQRFIDSVNPRPAFWLDIDVDLYISARQVLDFMFAHKLILPETIISYDDWGGTAEYQGGESLAHREMCEKYGVLCEEIHRSDIEGDIQMVFIVKNIKDTPNG